MPHGLPAWQKHEDCFAAHLEITVDGTCYGLADLSATDSVAPFHAYQPLIASIRTGSTLVFRDACAEPINLANLVQVIQPIVSKL